MEHIEEEIEIEEEHEVEIEEEYEGRGPWDSTKH